MKRDELDNFDEMEEEIEDEAVETEPADDDAIDEVEEVQFDDEIGIRKGLKHVRDWASIDDDDLLDESDDVAGMDQIADEEYLDFDEDH